MRNLSDRSLVEGDFISHANAGLALAAQKNMNKQLGEILVDLGVLDRQQQQVVFRIQDDLSDPERALSLAAGIRLKLGEMLVDVGLADRQQLDEALEEQARTGQMLGEIALRQGWLNPGQLDRALRFQEAQSEKGRVEARLCLGELLVATGDISRAQLDNALARQRDSGKLLGSELVDAGYLKPTQLASGLRLQRTLVALAMAATLALGAATGIPSAEAAGSANAQVSVGATVLRHVSIRVLELPRTIQITTADITRGYVDVPVSSKLEIRSNSPSGFMLSIESQADFARGTEVRGIGGVTSFGRFGGVLSVQTGAGSGMQTMPVELSFRVLLSEQARPGVHSWPIQISVLPA